MSEAAVGTVVIGVGNEFRHDDGAGVAVVRRLKRRLPPGVTVLEMSGEGASLIEAWQGASSVVLIDAARSGALPGTIHRFDAATPVPSGLFSYTTHQFSVAEAIELARSLQQLPLRLVVYGIEGADFAPGIGLSPAVEEAVKSLAAEICGYLKKQIKP